MTNVGRGYYVNFILDLVPRPLVFTTAADLWRGGLWFSLAGMAILIAHEMGHYLACRSYGISASLPYFLPHPGFGQWLWSPFGTFGAFIRIREPFPHRKALFDVGVAGPYAGFVVALGLLAFGIASSRVVKFPSNFVGIDFGEPIVFRAISWWFWGRIPEGYTLNLHPVGFAAWAGCFLTAVNLLPIWQLDGGHIAYAVIGRHARHVTLASTAAMFAVAIFYSTTWLGWAIIISLVLLRFGPDHAPTLHDNAPIGTVRAALAVVAFLILVLCFTPVPIDFTRLIGAG
jgi:membrane-associated protease RseP (regulator of RpoE activity)